MGNKNGSKSADIFCHIDISKRWGSIESQFPSSLSIFLLVLSIANNV